MSHMNQKHDGRRNKVGLDDGGEMCEQDFGSGILASVATEKDIDDITNFLRLFGFPRSDSKTANEVPFYANPALPFGAYSETEVRSHLFHYTAAFFMLRKNGMLSALLIFRFPLPQFSNKSVMMDLILSVYGGRTDPSFLSELMNFACNCLPRISIVECTKVKGLVLKDSLECNTMCEWFTKNGFVKESILSDEFGPKKDVVIFSRWLAPHTHT